MTKQVEGLWIVQGFTITDGEEYPYGKPRVATTTMGRDMAIKAAKKPWYQPSRVEVTQYDVENMEVYNV